IPKETARRLILIERDPQRLRVVNYTHTSSTRIEWHFDPARRRIDVKADRGAHAEFSISFIDDSDRCLAVTEVRRDRFEGEEESLVELGRRQHLRRRLDKDVVLTQMRSDPLGIRGRERFAKLFLR